MTEFSDVFLLLSAYDCALADSKLPSQLLSCCLFWIPDFHFAATDWSVLLLLQLPSLQRPLGAGTGDGVILMCLGLYAGLLFLSLCGDHSHSVLWLWILQFTDKWVLWRGEFLSDFTSKLAVESGVLQERPALSCSGQKPHWLLFLIMWSVVRRPCVCPDVSAVLQVGVLLDFLKADVTLCWPWVLDVDILERRGLAGGLGIGGDRGGGGCGLRTDGGDKVFRLSELCAAVSLWKRNQKFTN